MYKDANALGEDVTDVEAIKNSLRNILTTQRGTVPGRPRFGCDLYKVIFSPLDHLTESVAKSYIRESINEFESRITLDSIDFQRVEEFNKMIITLDFTYSDDQFSSNQQSVAVSFEL